MKSKPKIKDLGLKIGSKEEVAWTNIRDNAQKEIDSSKRIIIMDELLLKLCNKKILEEKEKLK